MRLYLFITLGLLIVSPLFGQGISGPTTVCVGKTNVYTASTIFSNSCWGVTGGTILDETETSATIEWNQMAGMGVVEFHYDYYPPNGGEPIPKIKTRSVTKIDPLGGSVTSSSVCIGSNGSVSLTGNSHSVLKWQKSTNDGNTWIDIVNTTTSQSFVNLQQTTWFRAVIEANTCQVNSGIGVVEVNLPSIGGTLGANLEIFGHASGSISLSGEVVGIVEKWQFKNDDTWEDIINNTSTLNYDINEPTYFRVQVRNGACAPAFSNVLYINVIEYPEINTGTFKNLRPGQSTILSIDEGFLQYEWFKDEEMIPISNAYHCEVNRPGEYKVKVYTQNANYTSEKVIINSQLDVRNNNAVVTYQFKVPLEEELDILDIYDLPTNHVAIAANFYDGLGRPIQQVHMGMTGQGNDLVLPLQYDRFGRIAKDYLPYVPVSNGALFRSDAPMEQASFDLFDGDSVTSSRKKFETSPLNRILEQSSPGEAWRLKSDGSGKTVKFSYDLNTVQDDVRIWKMNSEDLPVTPTTFNKNELQKSITTDEDGGQLISFVNRLGQTILKRIQVTSTTWADTYYVYDIYGNLRVVISPQGTEAMKNTGTPWTPDATELTQILNNWSFIYKYDNRNRMIEKKVPGAEKVLMVYDKWDRLVLTQDGNQRDHLVGGGVKWMFTKYDALNRPVLTGIISDSNINLTAIEDKNRTDDRFDSYAGDTGTDVFGYTQTSLPIVTEADVLTVTYYDNYDFYTDHSWDASLNYTSDGLIKTETQTNVLYTQPTIKNSVVRGLVTGSLTRNLGDDSMIKTASYYNDKYRVIQTVSTNVRGGYDRVSILYNFIGEVLLSKTTHYDSPSDPTANVILDDFEYDHGGRLLSTTTTIDGNSTVTNNVYNELSQLIAKDLNGLQEVNYDYNIRGWLTTINGGTSFDNAEDVFGMELIYNVGSTGGLFNGNISQIDWKNVGGEYIPSSNPPLNFEAQTFAFAYDKLNRLKTASYTSMGSSTGAYDVTGSDNGIAYDLNGNIQSLKRSFNGALVDDLAYTYTKGNQLDKVDELATVTPDELFMDDVNPGSTDDYTYDLNGNMISDENKGITSIFYNHLNLPEKVEFDANNYILYTYDAAGIKLKQEVYKNGTLNAKREYAGGFHYVNDDLEFVQTAEGRYVFGTENHYEYHLKDHLGNTRATVYDNNGTPEVAQRDDYYPFGLTFNSFTRSYSTEQRYKYNGFEEQVEWGVYDYLARYYDPAIGRFLMVDPLSEVARRWSPFTYGLNNPIRFIDPDGMMAEEAGKGPCGDQPCPEENTGPGTASVEYGQEAVQTGMARTMTYTTGSVKGSIPYSYTVNTGEIVSKRQYDLDGGVNLPKSISTVDPDGNNVDVEVIMGSGFASDNFQSPDNKINKGSVDGYVAGVKKANEMGAGVTSVTVNATTNANHGDLEKADWNTNASTHYIPAGARGIDTGQINRAVPNKSDSTTIKFQMGMDSVKTIRENFGPAFKNYKNQPRPNVKGHNTWIHTSFSGN